MSSESEVVVDNQAEEVPVVVDSEKPTEATVPTEADEAQAPAAADVTPEASEDAPAEMQSEHVSAETEEVPATQTEEEKPKEVNDEAKEGDASAPEAPSDEARFQAVHEKALEAKDQGTSFYKAQQFTSAKVKYAEALASIQNQSGDFTNEQRAIIFEMSLTCSSNLALCSWSLNEFQECIVHGRNTLLLIQAIESKLSDSQIWEELVKKGMSKQKLTSLKLKALRIIGKAEFEKGDYDDSKNDLEAALRFSEDAKVTKELNDLLQKCQKKIAQQSKKEKSMWKKAFETNNKVPDSEDVLTPPVSPTRPKPSTSVPTSNKSDAPPSNDGALTTPSYFQWIWLPAVLIGVSAFGAWWYRRRR